MSIGMKEAVTKAIESIADMFEAENLENIGLEEVSLNETENVWEITVGFSRPWDKGSLMGDLARQANKFQLDLMRNSNPLAVKRAYKVVKVDSASGMVKSIKIREVQNA
jgi:hypothetical protein